MKICLNPSVVEKIKQIDLSKTTTSQQRIDIFKQFTNEKNAVELSKNYERSLLLKNQEKAYQKFIDTIDIKGIEKKAELKDKIAKRFAERNALIENNPEQFDALMKQTEFDIREDVKDALNKKYGADISNDVADNITKLNNEVKQAKNLPKEANGDFNIEYGRAKVRLNNEIESITNPSSKMGFFDTLGARAGKVRDEWNNAENFFQKSAVAANTAGNILLSPAYKAIKSSIDLSYALNQGYKVLLDNPSNFWKGIVESFSSIPKAGKDEVIDEFRAKLISSKGFQDAIDSGLRLGGTEEYFADNLFEKVPGLGRLTKTSDYAYTIFNQGNRFRIFNDMVEKATTTVIKDGKEVIVKPSKEVMKNFATIANSITGSGTFGKTLEQSIQTMNKIFYAPRYIKSAIDTVTMPFSANIDKATRIRSAKLLAKYVTTGITILGTAKMLYPDRVELDPRSSKFGRIKVGDHWFNVLGNMRSYITLASRVMPTIHNGNWGFYSKSAKDNSFAEMNTGKYGTGSVSETAGNFLNQKLAPIPSTVQKVWGKNEEYGGGKPTVASTLSGLVSPITAGNFVQNWANEDFATAFFIGLPSILGIDETNYKNKKNDVNNPLSAIGQLTGIAK